MRSMHEASIRGPALASLLTLLAPFLGACSQLRTAPDLRTLAVEPFAERTFESTRIWNTDVAADPRGGFVVAGIVVGAVGLGDPIVASGQDGFVAWFDDTGAAVRSVALRGPDTETRVEIAVDGDGVAAVVHNVVEAGVDAAPPPRGGYPPSPHLHKLDYDGRRAWSKPLPSGTKAGPAIDADGNIYVSGASAYFRPGQCELSQWSARGSQRWRRTLLESSALCSGDIRADPARALVWAVVERGGPAEPLGGSEPRDVRALAFSSNGEQRGEVRLPADDWQAIDLYEPLADGGVLLLGRDAEPQHQLSAFWGLATTEGPAWLRRLETGQLQPGKSAIELPGSRRRWLLAGALAGPMDLGGTRLEGGTDRRSVLLALQEDGEITWARLLPGTGDEYSQRVVRLRSGRVVLVSTRDGSALIVRDVTALAAEAAS
jgi:outer membrane protein assembly factor BamB